MSDESRTEHSERAQRPRSPRVPVDFSVELDGTTADGKPFHAQAAAVKVSRGGATLITDAPLRLGARVRLTRHNLKLEPSVMLRLVRLSGTATFQVFIGMASWIGLVRTISSFGTDAVAGYIIGIRVILFALLPSWGMSNAAAAMVGQALGAGKPDRAERAVWKAGFYNLIFLGCVGLIFVIFARQIINLFTHDPNVVPYGVDCLRIVARPGARLR